MAKFTLVFYCKRPSKNRLTQNEIDCCLLWLEYLVGAFELLSTVLSTDDGVTDFWFLNFRLFTSEKRKKTPLQLDSIEVSTAVIYGLILQQVFPYETFSTGSKSFYFSCYENGIEHFRDLSKFHVIKVLNE